MSAWGPRHQSLKVFGNLSYLSLPGGADRLGSMCGLASRPVVSAALAVDLRIADRCVNGDGALQGIVEKREAHSFRS
ncbi:hypothetical protein StoSoilB22_09820 [Arthrobacter sp. StoSoilB22]|nr:hypothetical protein StoSoilB22_09820 [Arthrobacter sp. StoSoilB22]